MLIYPGVAPLDVAGPLEVFGVANFLNPVKLYDIITVSPTGDPVPTALGLSLRPAAAMAALPLPVDTLLVSGGGAPDAGSRPEILAWLRQAAPQARRFGSICTGAFALGAAGLLDGKRVATHWAFGAELARRYPAARVDVDPIFIRDGALYSSAGISAGIDLALGLLEEDHGRDFALSVARFLVLFLKRSGGQAQFSTQLQAQFSSVSAIQQVQRWCHDNLADDLSIGALAKRAAMSQRSFARAFREDTGRTPAEFVATARLQMACRLLEDDELPLKTIARRCGFASRAGMGRAFIKRLGVTPSQYRDKFEVKDAGKSPRPHAHRVGSLAPSAPP